MASINIPPAMMPGMTPAKNIRPTDTSTDAAYTTMTIDGGMRIPSVPALAMMPAAKSLEYPIWRMPAIAIVPMATTVAGEEPDKAANSMQAKTEDMARPPRKCPTAAIAKRINRFATPPVDIYAEARIKNGMASNV